jgi:Lecithin retinol acyltransferase
MRHSIQSTPAATQVATAARRVADIEPPVGAHLVTPRRGYAHHGIYVGANRVVHYAGLSRALLRGPVEEVSLAEFAGGRGVSIKSRPRPRFVPREVVARARSRLGENRYRLTTNNCEHFCEWCLSGESRSEQVERVVAGLRTALMGAGKCLRGIVGSGLNTAPGISA